jgi:anti-sigma regulatory factor (Ser/Thr protein kinase)
VQRVAIDDEVGSQEAVEFPPEPSSLAVAREYVRRALDGLPSSVVEDAVLLTSEIGGNAIVHARTAWTLKVTVGGEIVRIDVTDTGGGSPAIADPQPAIGGLGLRLVDQVATRWGTLKEDDDTVVWFELEP